MAVKKKTLIINNMPVWLAGIVVLNSWRCLTFIIMGFYAGTAEISVTPVSAPSPVHPINTFIADLEGIMSVQQNVLPG
ncbi:hypothetical protein MKF93_004735 [Salmonella enterica]|nr:hypothetical protein [Salmonella enterica]EIX2164480.1 hypothetical protein [Salmonella enterica]